MIIPDTSCRSSFKPVPCSALSKAWEISRLMVDATDDDDDAAAANCHVYKHDRISPPARVTS